MTKIQLTEEQRKQVISDADQTVEMLSDQQVEDIATKLNSWVGLPFMSEEREQVVFVKLVKKIDRFETVFFSLYFLLF